MVEKGADFMNVNLRGNQIFDLEKRGSTNCYWEVEPQLIPEPDMPSRADFREFLLNHHLTPLEGAQYYCQDLEVFERDFDSAFLDVRAKYIGHRMQGNIITFLDRERSIYQAAIDRVEAVKNGTTLKAWRLWWLPGALNKALG